jgi:hypothetical protein
MAEFRITSNRKDVQGESVVFVDDDCVEDVSRHSWHIHNGKYVATVIHLDNGDKDYQYLHRFVLRNTISDRENSRGLKSKVKFIDGNYLNCCRSNLLIMEPAIKPVHTRDNCTSQYKNISYIRATNKWRAKLKHDGRVVIEKQFSSEQDALNALNEAKKQINNEIVLRNENVAENLLKIEKWNGSSDLPREQDIHSDNELENIVSLIS